MTNQASQHPVTVEQPLNLPKGEIHIWQIDLDQQTHDMSFQQLADDDRQRCETFISTIDRNRYIRSRIALRSILGDVLGVSGNKLEFGKRKQGKPFIIVPKSKLEFNMTHSYGKALLALCLDTQVGVDLEYIRPRTSMIKIAQRMFSEQIVRELQETSSEKLPAEFYSHWTEYEAIAKCQGIGIFNVNEQEAGINTIHFSPDPGWIACLAIKSDQKIVIKLNQFY